MRGSPHDPFRAAIFDLDGVLVDTARYHCRAWHRLAAIGPADTEMSAVFVGQNKSVTKADIVIPDLAPAKVCSLFVSSVISRSGTC